MHHFHTHFPFLFFTFCESEQIETSVAAPAVTIRGQCCGEANRTKRLCLKGILYDVTLTKCYHSVSTFCLFFEVIVDSELRPLVVMLLNICTKVEDYDGMF